MSVTSVRPVAVRCLRRLSRALHAFLPRLAGLLGGLMATGAASAAELPDERAELMVHSYNGGGVRAAGPALLVRKNLVDRVSLNASYYVDMVSNASIDVVTTASPYKERRREESAGFDVLVRDALVTFVTSRSREPDFTADTASLDVAQQVFGGMTTIDLGYTRGFDTIGKRGTIGQFDRAVHSRVRLGATQVLTPRLSVNVHAEALTDDGLLASPYRVARVFGAAVPERVPRTRSARAVRLGAIGDLGSRTVLRAEFRYTYDTWEVRARTVEFGLRERLGSAWLVDAYVRGYSQSSAVFYRDNAVAETSFVSRNRQLSTFHDSSVGAKVAYAAGRYAGRFDVRFKGAYERVRYGYDDFTDIRTGQPYSHDANVFQFSVSASF